MRSAPAGPSLSTAEDAYARLLLGGVVAHSEKPLAMEEEVMPRLNPVMPILARSPLHPGTVQRHNYSHSAEKQQLTHINALRQVRSFCFA